MLATNFISACRAYSKWYVCVYCVCVYVCDMYTCSLTYTSCVCLYVGMYMFLFKVRFCEPVMISENNGH